MRIGSRAVKRLLLVGAGSALVFTMGGIGSAQADNGPHMSTGSLAGAIGVKIVDAGAGKCASCHRAHTAQAERLLLDAQPGLCYTCHSAGAGASTDVANGVLSGGTKTPLRGGGFNTAAIGTGAATRDMGALDAVSGRIPAVNQNIPVLAAPVATTSRHEINGVSGTAWGNGPISTTIGANANVGKAVTLQCGSCHDPHGNGNYRILRTNPVDSQWVVTAAIPAVYNTATPPVLITAAVPAVMSAASNIRIPDARAYGYTTGNYWQSGDTNVPVGGSTVLTGTALATDLPSDGYIQNVAAWCTTCHTRYLAPTGSGKTSSGDAVFKYRHRSDANYKGGAANCITCHVSHGSNAVMNGDTLRAGVTMPGGVAPPTAGDSRLLRVDNRGTCVMCHNK